MAVEAQHLNLFPSQLIANREIMNAIESNGNNMFNTQMDFGVPLSGITTETLLPYISTMADSFPATTTMTMKADSGLTYNLSVPRKRSRDSTNPFISFPLTTQKDHRGAGPFSFLGEDISLQIQQQQLEIDRLIAQHTEKVRLELSERRKRFSRRLVAAVEEGILKKLRAKEEEMEKIGKLNWVLEERVKFLCLENQMWRDMAQTNEATANALRSNLEQVLAQVKDHRGTREDESVADDAESCCGSSDFGDEREDEKRRRILADNGGERNWVKDKSSCGNNGKQLVHRNSNSNGNIRWCRNCGKEESCVLLLPCRHLCLCTLCGSTLHICPVCKSTKNASVHVNMS